MQKSMGNPSRCCVLLLLFLALHLQTSCFVAGQSFSLDNILNFGQTPTIVNNEDWTESEDMETLIKPLDDFLNNFMQPMMGLPGRDINGTDAQFRKAAMDDDSNDDAAFMSHQELIKRSGFDYEIYEVTSDDGYITQITRIVNPLADPTKLRYPPVMMMHGGLIDPTIYLIASSIQHFPEPWPRLHESEDYGVRRSSNRSLAFMLANNGFDVYLPQTRGNNEYNTRHIKTKALESALEGKNAEKNLTRGEVISGINKQWNYWSFTEDDVIQHEIKAQMDKVMEVSGADKVALSVFSLSTRTSLGFLASRPDYAKKLAAYVVVAPIVSGEGMAGLGKMIIQEVCANTPNFMGRFMLTNIALTPQIRSFIVELSKPKWLRYSITKFLVSVLVGTSAKYRTNLELNVLSHIFLHLSYKMVKQMCQSTASDSFQKYDYGNLRNKLIYNNERPPVYNLSNLQLDDWITVVGTNDNFATMKSYDHLLEIVNPQPVEQHIVQGWSHLDLFAAFENDIYVNFPILNYLIRKSDQYSQARSVGAGQQSIQNQPQDQVQQPQQQLTNIPSLPSVLQDGAIKEQTPTLSKLNPPVTNNQRYNDSKIIYIKPTRNDGTSNYGDIINRMNDYRNRNKAVTINADDTTTVRPELSISQQHDQANIGQGSGEIGSIRPIIGKGDDDISFGNGGVMPAATISSRTFNLPFLDFKPENIIEASSGSGKGTDKQNKDDKPSPLDSLFKLNKLLTGGGEANKGLEDLIKKPLGALKALGNTANNLAGAKPTSLLPLGLSPLSNVPEFAKKPLKTIEEARSIIHNMFIDLAKLMLEQNKKNTTSTSTTSSTKSPIATVASAATQIMDPLKLASKIN